MLPPSPTMQLRDAQYALAAADCAQLALMLAVSVLWQAWEYTSSRLQRHSCGSGRINWRVISDRPPNSITPRPYHAGQLTFPSPFPAPLLPCPQNERLRAAAYADTLSALQMEHAAAGEVLDASGLDERASSIAAAVERVRRLGRACCGLF